MGQTHPGSAAVRSNAPAASTSSRRPLRQPEVFDDAVIVEPVMDSEPELLDHSKPPSSSPHTPQGTQSSILTSLPSTGNQSLVSGQGASAHSTALASVGVDEASPDADEERALAALHSPPPLHPEERPQPASQSFGAAPLLSSPLTELTSGQGRSLGSDVARVQSEESGNSPVPSLRHTPVESQEDVAPSDGQHALPPSSSSSISYRSASLIPEHAHVTQVSPTLPPLPFEEPFQSTPMDRGSSIRRVLHTAANATLGFLTPDAQNILVPISREGDSIPGLYPLQEGDEERHSNRTPPKRSLSYRDEQEHSNPKRARFVPAQTPPSPTPWTVRSSEGLQSEPLFLDHSRNRTPSTPPPPQARLPLPVSHLHHDKDHHQNDADDEDEDFQRVLNQSIRTHGDEETQRRRARKGKSRADILDGGANRPHDSGSRARPRDRLILGGMSSGVLDESATDEDEDPTNAQEHAALLIAMGGGHVSNPEDAAVQIASQQAALNRYSSQHRALSAVPHRAPLTNAVAGPSSRSVLTANVRRMTLTHS